jgi:hypothetical protein
LLQRVHGDKYKEYQLYKTEWTKPESAPKPGAKRKASQPSLSVQDELQTKKRLHQTRLCPSTAVDTIISQSHVDKLITNYVVKGLHALKTVEDQEFVDLVVGLCPSANVMSRRTLVRRIDDKFDAKMLGIKDELAKQQYVCTTADMWSLPRKSYLGVTCHWIDAESLSRKSVALACRRFKGAHTHDRIAEMLYDINAEFGLSPNKIVATVTDNGANFVKAFKEFGVKIDVTTDDDDDEDDVDIGAGQVPNETVPADEDVIVEFVPIFDATNQTNLLVLPTHVRCASHTLSLVGTTDANSALKNSAQFSRLNHTVMGKCCALWNAGSRPKSAEKIAEICDCSLRTPCATRWNSLFDSVTGLLEKRDVLPRLMAALNLPSFKDLELDFLEEYRQTLVPIAVALDRLQGDKNTYYADLLPTLFSVNKQLAALQSVNLRYCAPLLNAVTIGFQRRFADFLRLTPDDKFVNMAIMATITHPFFKLRWLPSSLADQRSRLQSLLVSNAKKIALDSPAQFAEPKADDTDDDYYGFTDNTVNTDTASVNTTACGTAKHELEVFQFLEDSHKDITMLNNYPIVKALFLQFNAVLPSSAPVERLFSFAGIIARPHRRKMSDKTFEQLLVLKEN